MTDRRIDGFFYGLFMDAELLRENGVDAASPRRAFVDGYSLRLGRRATLVPSSGDRAWGMIYALTHEELGRLYGAPGLKQYLPEAVLAHTMEGDSIPALCYNLAAADESEKPDPNYAVRLRAALEELGFPSDYIASIY